MDSKHIKVDKNQQIEKKMTPLLLVHVSHKGTAHFRLILPEHRFTWVISKTRHLFFYVQRNFPRELSSVVVESTPSESKIKTESWATESKTKTESSASESKTESETKSEALESKSSIWFIFVTILLSKRDQNYEFIEIFYFHNIGYICRSGDGLISSPWVIKA